jgi:tRNA nucleotidyltransferase (CCA-adding enzyme)
MEMYQTPAAQLVVAENEYFSEEFISASIENYLKENGYKIQKQVSINISGKEELVIVGSKYFEKEIIEVKGYPKTFEEQENSLISKKTSAAHHVKKWFSEALFSSFVNFGKYYSNQNVLVAMALPNVSRSKAVIEIVKDYFTENNLYFKIYLVNENGDVEILNLNEKFSEK